MWENNWSGTPESTLKEWEDGEKVVVPWLWWEKMF